VVDKAGNLSKSVIEHVMNRHLPSKVQQEIPYLLQKMPRGTVEKIISERSYFNKNWNEEQVTKAIQMVFDSAVKAGVRTGTHTLNVFGERVTVVLKDGVLKTSYGDNIYKLIDFGY